MQCPLCQILLNGFFYKGGKGKREKIQRGARLSVACHSPLLTCSRAVPPENARATNLW